MLRTHDEIKTEAFNELRAVLKGALAEAHGEVADDLGKVVIGDLLDQVRKGNLIGILVRIEKPIETGKPDIEILGGLILVEVKKDLRDLGSERAVEQADGYLSYYGQVSRLVLLVSWDARRGLVWKACPVDGGKIGSIRRCFEVADREGLVQLIKRTVLTAILEQRGIKRKPTSENIAILFKPLLLEIGDLKSVYDRHRKDVEALYEAYRNMMERIYAGLEPHVLEGLYMKHTVLQMIVSASLTVAMNIDVTDPIDACSGEKVGASIVLPYLNWWRAAYDLADQDGKGLIRSLCSLIYSRALQLDWGSVEKEDVFRELYEQIIDKETRRKLQEYYTPRWMVEFMVEKAHSDLKKADGKGLMDKVVLDPFCGSGSFLVAAFYKKVEEGEDPDKALEEVIGIDLNPLAVSIARAVLLLAYNKVTGGKKRTPLVFNADSSVPLLRFLARLRSGHELTIAFLRELRQIETIVSSSLIVPPRPEDIKNVMRLEAILERRLAEAFPSRYNEGELNVVMSRLIQDLREFASRVGGVSKLIVENLLKSEVFINNLKNLIKRYGDGVWAASISSLVAPYMIAQMKVDVAISNPPWSPLNRFKGAYGDFLRGAAGAIVEKYGEKMKGMRLRTPSVLGTSNIASVMLRGCIEASRSYVAFVMPASAMYEPSSAHGLGKLLTYLAVERYGGEVYYIALDAFEHGEYPGLVFIDKSSLNRGFTCYRMIARRVGGGRVWKHLQHGKEVDVEVEELESYADAIKPLLSYAGADREGTDKLRALSHKELKRLNILNAIPEGTYVSGILGGEKRSEEKYAGLVFEVTGYDPTYNRYHIRLSGTSSHIALEGDILIRYWKKLIDRGMIYPFYLEKTYDVLLSSEGEERLKNFLRNTIMPRLRGDDRDCVEKLVQELKQGKLSPLRMDRYYVVYRLMRTFVSTVLTPSNMSNISSRYTIQTSRGAYEITDTAARDIVISHHCSYIEVDSEDKAYYYAATLNYLAYKVVKLGRSFIRDQFARPLYATLDAGLEWKGEEWQVRVAELSKRLHQKAPRLYAGQIKKGMQVKALFEILERDGDFTALVRLFDENVDKNMLEKAILMVSEA